SQSCGAGAGASPLRQHGQRDPRARARVPGDLGVPAERPGQTRQQKLATLLRESGRDVQDAKAFRRSVEPAGQDAVAAEPSGDNGGGGRW
ncbi:unnamed protein product, partial [Ectocarpus sp. 8 AP-2014]